MHLAYLNNPEAASLARRSVLKGAVGCGAVAVSAMILGSSPALAAEQLGFKGSGRMGMSTGEDWIDTFFTGGADKIIHYYADNFVFEDITFAQTIDTKEDLYRAFVPFNNAGPDSPLGVHQFDIIRYNGGTARGVINEFRRDVPEGYTAEQWAKVSRDTRVGEDLPFDEWASMQWVWKATHNGDFLGMPAKGKTTVARGTTSHFYKNRKITREYTHWDFRGVGVQLGVIQPQEKFWLKDYRPSGS